MQQHQKKGALVQRQPCQRNRNDRCHQALRNKAVVPLSSPHQALCLAVREHTTTRWRSENTSVELRRGSRRGSTTFCTYSADTRSHGRPQRKCCSWLERDQKLTSRCCLRSYKVTLSTLDQLVRTMPRRSAAHYSQNIFPRQS